MNTKNTTLTKIKSAIGNFKKECDDVPFSVLLWGPGDDVELVNKRKQIQHELKINKISVETGESVAKYTKSHIALVDEELIHWRHFDAIIVLESGIAPAMEISAYAFFPGFCQKCLVFHPVDWGPSRRRQSYPSDMLAAFPYRFPYTDSDIKECMLVSECLSRVKALKRTRWLDTKGLVIV